MAKIDNHLLEKIYTETLDAFNQHVVKRPTESDFSIQSSAIHILKGIDIAQYFMVEPLIDTLTDYLPKPIAKEAFKKICVGIQANTEQYLQDKESLDVAIYHNRNKLQQIGIPEEQWGDYGGKYAD